MSAVVPVILCGGSGSRLWPLSRRDRPKQLITLSGEYSLLEGTLLRAKTIPGAIDPICVTAMTYGNSIRLTLDQLGLQGRLLLEPQPRNTAPALCAAAIVALQIDPNAVIVALPSDHYIEDSKAFAVSISYAVAAAEKSWLTVLGVKPRNISTALGYIMPDLAIEGLTQTKRVNRFIEKPELELAKYLIASGALWNAGIVVSRAELLINAIQKLEPAMLEAVKRSLINGVSKVDEVQLSEADFVTLPSISFDKAVLERFEAIAVTELGTMWRDLGTWSEVAELYPADKNNNRKIGKVRLSSSRDTFVYSCNRQVVGLGLENLIIVDTPDALLVADRKELDRSPSAAVEMANAPNSESSTSGLSVQSSIRPGKACDKEWGSATCLSLASGAVSQRGPHQDYSRHWIVLCGTIHLTIEGKKFTYNANQCFYVLPGDAHKIENPGPDAAKLVEIHQIRIPTGQM